MISVIITQPLCSSAFSQKMALGAYVVLYYFLHLSHCTLSKFSLEHCLIVDLTFFLQIKDVWIKWSSQSSWNVHRSQWNECCRYISCCYLNLSIVSKKQNITRHLTHLFILSLFHSCCHSFMIVMPLTFHGTKLSTMLFLDDVHTITFVILVFEMGIGMNEFDHRILLPLKQQYFCLLFC